MTRSTRRWCLASAVVLLAATALAAGPAASRPADPPKPALPAMPQIDSSTIATAAESAQITLRQVEAQSAADRLSPRVRAELPTLSLEIDARLDETANLLAGNASLQVLDEVDQDWQAISRELDGWWHGLDRRRATLADLIRPGDPRATPPVPPGELATLEAPWRQSAPAFDYYAAHPKSDAMRDRMYDAAARTADVVESIDLTRTDVQAQLSDAYGLLNDVDRERARVQDVIESAREARDQAWNRLFQRDGTPIWSLFDRRPAAAAGRPGRHHGRGADGSADARRTPAGLSGGGGTDGRGMNAGGDGRPGVVSGSGPSPYSGSGGDGAGGDGRPGVGGGSGLTLHSGGDASGGGGPGGAGDGRGDAAFRTAGVAATAADGNPGPADPGAADPTVAAPADPAAAVAAPRRDTVRRQAQAVAAYLLRHRENVAAHLALIAAAALGLLVARRWVRRWAEADPSLNRAMLAFSAPIATALVLSFFAAVYIYPQAPRLFWAGLGAATLVPTVYLLRRVVERRLFFLLDALVAFYFADQVRLVAAAVPVLARGLFLAEMLGGTAVLALFIRARRGRTPADVLGWAVVVGTRVWLGVFAACLVADAVGYVSLAELVGGAALGGAYLAVILYAATRIVGGLGVLLVRSRPLVLLASVRRHQPLLLARFTAAVDWVAAAFWAFGVLNLLSAGPSVAAAAGWFWRLPVHLGALQFTPSHLVEFGLTVYASFLLSRFVQFVLNEDVFGHVHLAGGLAYAINRLVHYAVVVAGFYLAMGAVGGFSQLNLVVTALTVGLGFGLQNVVNNFVSGLILLFERPIKVGDLIQMSDTTTGTVEYIGIRASIIRSADSSEVIVPNGNLISNQLTNWTLTNRQRGLSIPVTLGPDADPQRVMKLLAEVAAAHPLVVAAPAPVAFLVKFGADAFNYELHAWTDSADQWVEIRSDLSVALHTMLVREAIAIK